MVPRKANTPTLTREQIVSAAIAVVDREGLEALSMRRLAAELGMSAMSLYYHVPDKSALYDLILEAIMREMDLSADDPAEEPEERCMKLGYALRNALLAHPHAAPIAMGRSLRTPGQLRPIEALLGVLFDIGLSPTDAMRAVNVIGQYVFGTTAAYASHLAESEYHEDEDPEAPIAALPAEEFPHLMRALSEAEHGGWDADFDAGLRALVAGLVLGRADRD